MELRKWTDRELELSRKHEELLMRREALLRGTESYFNTKDRTSSSFIADIKQAEERNTSLVQDVKAALTYLDQEQHAASPQFEKLRKNYWSMVKSVFPVWLDEYNRETTSKSYHPENYHARSGSGAPHDDIHQYSPAPARVTNLPPPIGTDRRKLNVRRSDDEATIAEIPPLDLDFCMGEDITSQNVTPKMNTMETSQTTDKSSKKERRVHYDEASLTAAQKGKVTSKSKSKSKKNIT